MQPTLEIRRHGDGSIDYDFYRRRAMRRRRLARRLLAKRYWAAAGRLASAGIVAMRPALVLASRLITALVRWRRAQAERRQRLRAMATLGALPDHTLKDLGVSRSEIYWLVSHGRRLPPASIRAKGQDLPANPTSVRPDARCEPRRGAGQSSRAA